MTPNYYHINRDIEVGKRPRKLVKSAHSGASRTRWSSRNAREGSPVSPRTRTAKRRGRFRSSQREAYTVLKTGEPLRAVQAAIRRGLKKSMPPAGCQLVRWRKGMRAPRAASPKATQQRPSDQAQRHTERRDLLLALCALGVLEREASHLHAAQNMDMEMLHRGRGIGTSVHHRAEA